MAARMSRNIRLYGTMIQASIRAQFQYRYAFFMNILGWAMSYAGTAITMWTVLYRFQELHGWTFWQLLFLFALSVLSWGVCVIFFFHFRSMDQYILNGTFDRFLIRPIHPFFHFMAMKFDVGAFGQLLFSIIALCLAASHLHLQWQLLDVFVLIGAILGGTCIQGGLIILISAAAFWTTRSERLYWVIMFPAKSMMNYPLSIYPRLLQWLVTYLIPFAFVNYFPAIVLLGKAKSRSVQVFGEISPVIGLVFFYICYRIWMAGLNRYKSAGS
ncbi:ABC-2 family transporter protein [Fodinisporobacter ferrooxydans]|uniref:ABC-2 family transporter protein n=1 Tax=Fodinisporobacter ferrooxydans TaxID=2901836 RepID=A0ABY4CGQ4_9BACL|nr:ABC-2 family transporter protein [Alicyclobacillaceae bacterium MYW30-H2]